MTAPVGWLSEAEAELRQARDWYHAIRSELSERFALAVEETVEALARQPLRFPIVYRERRRAGVRRFPYGIIFEVQEHQILVIACFHAKRDPKRWKKR